MKQVLAKKILQQTQETYNAIAYDFSNTRNYIWQDILPLLDYSRKGAKVLDLGCGNGRLFEALKEKQVDYTGVDNSKELLKIAQQKYPQANFQLVNGISLPFKDKTFDIIYCVAVLHHIPSKRLRKDFLLEAKRVLRPNGLMVATVWKLGQKKSNLLPKFTLKKLFSKSDLDFGDVLVPWHNKAMRFVHNFTNLGLKRLFKQAGFMAQKTGVLLRPERRDYNLFIIGKNILGSF